ncbi:MAG: iron-sulfur cluster carrier protein ApbC [Candidatus Latescibacterota bacterium]|nr:MAG: iron-sulfur cluster carrier protein ApbC [Candidatus Latescibacterota bacterium]
MADPRSEQVLHILRQVRHPDLGGDPVSMGLVKDVRVEGTTVAVTFELPSPAAGAKAQLEALARQALAALPGVTTIDVKTTIKIGIVSAPQEDSLQGIKNIVAVASGKGGVGKSTVAVNLALALQQQGAATGLMDSDIYGPSIPIMMGTRDRPPGHRDQQILPVLAHGLKMMSIGFVAPANAPVIWRGPMVHKIVSEFLRNVAWGDLDYLVIDLPPGTGDAQLTLTQTAPLSGAVVVTTPQDVALEDVNRAVRMFEEVKVPVLGVVENMSFFSCPSCGHREEIFSHGGGKTAALRFEVPFLGEIPILPDIREASDRGLPIVAAAPDSAAGQAFKSIAKSVATQLASLKQRKKPTIKFS